MTTTTPSAALVTVAPVFTNTERLALAGFLAGYRGLTREAYGLDLRQYTSWCHQHQLRLFQARRADIECLARDLEARGRAKMSGSGQVDADGMIFFALARIDTLGRGPDNLAIVSTREF